MIQIIFAILIIMMVCACAYSVYKLNKKEKEENMAIHTHARSMGMVALYEARMRGCGDAPYGVLFDGVKVDTMEALVKGMQS